MTTWKPTNLTTSDYTFYANPDVDLPFTIVYNNRAWNFSFNDNWNYLSERCRKHGWPFNADDQSIRTFLPTFTDDYPEFFI